MSTSLVSDDLWEAIALLPPARPKPRGGLASPTAPLWAGILVARRTGVGWEALPQEPGRGSGMTCSRHSRDWGVWDELHAALLDRLGGQEWSRRDR